MTDLILGTASPRRREIFGTFAVPHRAVSPNFDERSIAFEGDPEAYTVAISDGKVDSLCREYPDAAVLTSDTTVYCEGRIFGKPHDEGEALEYLTFLSGRWQSVFTALSLRKGDAHYSICEETRVLLHETSSAQRQSYVKGVATHDKAGAYSIVGSGGLIVKKIDGCYYNVAGLPLAALTTILGKIGINLWEHIGSPNCAV